MRILHATRKVIGSARAMIVSEPRIREEGAEIAVSAAVRVEAPGLEMPAELWFRFPADHREYLTGRADGFAVALMPVAMLLSEPLIIEGRISPRVLHGLQEYRTAYHQWWPSRFTAVDIECADASVDRDGTRAGHAVGCPCSGGVDSLYSIWRHLPENEPLVASRLTHCLIVNGFNFDMDLEPSNSFHRVLDTYAPFLQRHGIGLVTARHNGQVFLEATGMMTQSSPGLEVGVLSAVLMLGNLFRWFYISSGATYRHEENNPHGFHPSILHLLSSEDTEVLIDGANASRSEKISTLARWEDTYDILRVCWSPPMFNERTGLVENCGRCPKCLRTMIALEASGALQKFRTFPGPLDRGLVRASSFVGKAEKLFYFDILEHVRAAGRHDLLRDLRYARFRSRLFAAIRDRVLRRLGFYRRRPVARKDAG